MPGLSQQKTTAFCELLSTTLKAYLDQMPHLKEEAATPSSTVAEASGGPMTQVASAPEASVFTAEPSEAPVEGSAMVPDASAMASQVSTVTLDSSAVAFEASAVT